MKFKRQLLKIAGLILMVCLLIGLFTPTGAVKPARAECTWGDIICDMQQAIQQLADNYVTPLKAWALLQASKALYSLQYGLAYTITAFMWSISKMLITVGVGTGILNEWLAVNFFQPMIQMSSTTMKPIFGVFMFAALGILGISYFLAAFVRLNVVSLRSVVIWWVAGAIFFSIGPGVYLSMRNLNQALNSLFYASSLSAVDGKNPFQKLANSDPAASNPVFAMSPLCSNFTGYIAGSAGKITGMDVSLAFQKADGFDVVSGGNKCIGGATAQDLPREWFAANGFFDALKSPSNWAGMVTCPPAPAICDYDLLVQLEVAKMQASVNQTFAGIARIWQAIPTVWFAIVEQLVALCLIIAQGLTFISFACAILFAFFKRTEPVAWAVIDQWLSLLVQTVVLALIQGMTIALYLSAAKSGSPLVSMAVSIVALLMMVILLTSGLKAIWSAFNRLFEAFGQASGGVLLSPGQAGSAMAGAALNVGGAAITGGLSLASGAASAAGSVMGGAQALGSGATWAQAAGITFGGSKALDGAAFQLSRLPALRDTALGEVSSQFMEGSAARRVGEGLLGAAPVVGDTLGKLGGASLGAALLTDHHPDHAEARLNEQGQVTWQQPMLRQGTGNAMTTLLRNPNWEDGQTSAPGGGGLPLQHADGRAVRRGDAAVEAEYPQSGWGQGEAFIPAKSAALNNDGNLDETLQQDFQRTLASEKTGSSKVDDDGGQALSNAASKLEMAGSSLKNASEAMGRSVQNADSQKRMEQVEGRLNVSGANNIAAVMGRTVNSLQGQNAATGQVGAGNEQVGLAMASAMGMTPVERDGKMVTPIEGRLTRPQLFADQALRMGLSGQDAAEIVREVKSSPDGMLSAATRDRLVHEQHETRGEAWADSVQNVRQIEHSARSLPSAISAYGTRTMPASASSEPVVLSPATSVNGPVIFTPVVANPPTIAPPRSNPVTFTTPAALSSAESPDPTKSALAGIEAIADKEEQ